MGDDGEAESGDDEAPERTAADDAYIDDDGVGPGRLCSSRHASKRI